MQDKQEVRKQMLAMIADWKASGLKQKEYCAAHQIAYHSLEEDLSENFLIRYPTGSPEHLETVQDILISVIFAGGTFLIGNLKAADFIIMSVTPYQESCN